MVKRISLDHKLSELELRPFGSDEFEPTNDSKLRAIESATGAALPSDYKAFLAIYGGCGFNVECKFPTEGGGVYLGYFLSADEILESLQYVDDYLPRQVIPIHDDGGGNILCISTRDDSYGYVYFRNHSIGWDDSAEDAENAKMRAMFQLSTSFTNFILSLEREE